MDTKPKLPSSSREMRNIAEKMRRDKLNNYVTELASIVPLVCGSSKRIDKTSVLRLAANYIRMHNILHDAEDKETTAVTPGPVHKAHLNMLEEVIGGFLLIMTSSGKVVFITESVETLFGHTQIRPRPILPTTFRICDPLPTEGGVSYASVRQQLGGW